MGEYLLGDPQGVEGIKAGIGTSVTASQMTDAYGETVARRRSAALLSEFGLSHVREYAPFDPSSAPCISSFAQSLSTFETNVREWHFVQHSLGASTLRVPQG